MPYLRCRRWSAGRGKASSICNGVEAENVQLRWFHRALRDGTLAYFENLGSWTPLVNCNAGAGTSGVLSSMPLPTIRLPASNGALPTHAFLFP